jgi:hypothetical protein
LNEALDEKYTQLMVVEVVGAEVKNVLRLEVNDRGVRIKRGSRAKLRDQIHR